MTADRDTDANREDVVCNEAVGTRERGDNTTDGDIHTTASDRDASRVDEDGFRVDGEQTNTQKEEKTDDRLDERDICVGASSKSVYIHFVK